MTSLRKQTLDPLALRPSVIDIDLDALSFNYKSLKNFVGNTEIMAIVKANAYGHGLVTCARHFVDCGVRWLAVACVEEGVELREAGVDVPILVLGGIVGGQIGLYIDYDLDITASSVFKLKAINEVAEQLNKKARVHLKIDTGMERIGMHWYSAEALIKESAQCSFCDVVGVYSHFAAAEDEEFSQLQIERFEEALSIFTKLSLPMPLRHLAASEGLIRYPQSHFDLVRPGIALYGAYPNDGLQSKLELRPAMSLRSKVVYFKVAKAGATVGYGRTYQVKNDTRIVTVPIGYGDGYLRHLSNKGQVLIGGKRYPVVGRICMDQLMVDIDHGEAYNGDEVVLLGHQGNERITLEEVAKAAETNTHHVLVSLNLRLPRRYHRGVDVFVEHVARVVSYL